MRNHLSIPFIIVENIIGSTDLESLTSSFSDITFSPLPNNPELYNYYIDSQFKNKKTIDLLNNELYSILEKLYGRKIKSYTTGNILRYTKGQSIGIHADWDSEDSYTKSQTDQKLDISSIFYFNEDFSGGELVFCRDKNLDESKLIIIKPQKNTAIFFDSSKFHYTNPILSGIKYSYTNFYSLH